MLASPAREPGARLTGRHDAGQAGAVPDLRLPGHSTGDPTLPERAARPSVEGRAVYQAIVKMELSRCSRWN